MGLVLMANNKEEQTVTRMRKTIDDEIHTAAGCLYAANASGSTNPVDSCGGVVGTEHILNVGLCPLCVPIDIHREPWTQNSKLHGLLRSLSTSTHKMLQDKLPGDYPVTASCLQYGLIERICRCRHVT